MTDQYKQFDFKVYKELICRATQITDFREAFKEAKELYLYFFDEHIPYPIKDHPEEYESFCFALENYIEENNLISIDFISKSQAMKKYKLNERFFELFYPQPEQMVLVQNSIERFGKNIYSKLYNENLIVEILESDEYHIYLEERKKKFNKFNY